MLTATVALGVIVAPSAQAVTQNDPSALAAIERVVPKVLDNQAEIAVQPGKEATFLSETTDVSVTLPADAGATIEIAEPGSTLSVRLPGGGALEELAEDVAVYDHGDGSETVPIVKNDGSVQITTVISDPSAPTRYDYAITISDGGYMEMLDNGFVVLHEKDGSWAGGIMPPWALDAAGKAVPTRYVINGSTLTQVVDHDSEGVSYPVTADPYMGKALISSVANESHENGYPRYNVFKTAYGQEVVWGSIYPGYYDLLFGRQIMMTYGWDEVVAKNSSVTQRPSVKQQYDCHIVYVASKNPYNLEAWRPSRPNWLTSPVSCNWA